MKKIFALLILGALALGLPASAEPAPKKPTIADLQKEVAALNAEVAKLLDELSIAQTDASMYKVCRKQLDECVARTPR